MLNDGSIGIGLDAIAADITHLALCDNYPGTAFDNEKSGGSPAYARETIAFTAYAAGRSIVQNGTAAPNVTGIVRWLAGATAVSAGIQRFVHPCDGAPKLYGLDLTENQIIRPGHGYIAAQEVVFYGTSVPGGITIGQVYLVRDVLTDSFKVEPTLGAGAVDIDAYPSTFGALVSAITTYNGGQRPFPVSGLVITAF